MAVPLPRERPCTDSRPSGEVSGSYFTPIAVPRYPTPMRSRTARAGTASCPAAICFAAAPVCADEASGNHTGLVGLVGLAGWP
jgi:hypothetical protein